MLCCGLLSALSTYAAETDSPPETTQEPTLHDHYVALKAMEERLASRSPEQQAKMQPQIQRAQQKACQRLRKDHQEGIQRDDYRRQGGNEFLVFSLELEQWCATPR